MSNRMFYPEMTECLNSLDRDMSWRLSLSPRCLEVWAARHLLRALFDELLYWKHVKPTAVLVQRICSIIPPFRGKLGSLAVLGRRKA